MSKQSKAVTIEVGLTPRASRDEVKGLEGGVLAVRVTAPPVDGRANEALRKLLAKEMGVAKRDVEIVRGQRARRKLVRIVGGAPEAVERLLRGEPGAGGRNR